MELQNGRPADAAGRGAGNSGDYLQLSLFPTEEEQLGEIHFFSCSDSSFLTFPSKPQKSKILPLFSQ